MIDFINKIIQSTVNNLIDSVGVLLIVIFYEITVLQLPVPEIFHMVGILALFTLGLNTILSSQQPTQVRPRV